MHLKPFEYVAPESLVDALYLLGVGESRPTPLAGGTDLLLQMKEGQREPAALMSLKHIEELKEIVLTPETCTFGAGVTVGRLATTELPVTNPCIADAIRQMATVQIRNRATIGGNLCTSAACADFPPVLLLNDAVLHLASVAGTRDVPISKFFTGLRQVDREPHELLVAISCQRYNHGSAYIKFGVRDAANISITGVACCLELDGDTVSALKVTTTAACPTSELVPAAADVGIGQPATEETWSRVAEVVKQNLSPISDLRGSAEYRLHLAEVGTVRVLRQAAERFRGVADA